MKNHTLSLQYLIKAPKNTNKKAPLLLMLHGYGSDEKDLFSFAQELPEDVFIVSARAPFVIEPVGNAWYAIHWNTTTEKFSDTEQAKKSVALIANFIDELITNYPIDKNNVSLLGFSQGSILSYAVALNFPEKIKNVVALSGYIQEDLLPKDIQTKNYLHLDFYCSHGSVDQVIPVAWARNTKPFLDHLGIKNQYSEFPVGHGVAPQNFFELKAWLEKRI
ncbi:MAG: phospholipase [Bacteroidetes bacterium HGW-Bacteroidetes-2]|jgi:phospholipase/carboxylesterase|nr:MAG: phospholipase [Bacteroidetes bacterium HGW-Bacteroidetes-2]